MKSVVKAAIITGMFGVISTLIVVGFPCLKSKEQKSKESISYIKIVNIRMDSLIQFDGLRLSGRVNKTYFTYPVNSLLVAPKCNLPNNPFEIKKEDGGFDCNIELMVVDKSCDVHYYRPYEQLIITSNDFLYSGVVYKMTLVDDGSESKPTCEVEFLIYEQKE